MNRPALMLVAAVMAAAAAPAPVQAASSNSGIDAYIEAIPSSGGDTPIGDGKRGGGDAGTTTAAPETSQALPADTATDFQTLGDDGAAAAAFAEGTAPAPSRTGAPTSENARPGNGSGASGTTAPSAGAAGQADDTSGSAAAEPESSITAVLTAATGLDGPAALALVPVLMLATAALYAITRRRRSAPAP